MKVVKAREIAAEVAGVGKSKIKIDFARMEDISKAITRDDIRALLKDGGITVSKENYQSRGRARVKHVRRKMGRGRKAGSKKGTLKAREKPKKRWIQKVRALRKELSKQKTEKNLETKEYRTFYRRVKGNWFKNKKHLTQTIGEGSKK
ncbi:MAG: 50S ribosomal protein L19e [Candidatus Diapherotrites archaeon]|nr:50S ribosomal protein L19e [Candidatus Diapherotrites archaeon]